MIPYEYPVRVQPLSVSCGVLAVVVVKAKSGAIEQDEYVLPKCEVYGSQFIGLVMPLKTRKVNGSRFDVVAQLPLGLRVCRKYLEYRYPV